jgi:hypothetical protein
VENTVEVPQKTKNRTVIGSNISSPGDKPEGMLSQDTIKTLAALSIIVKL